MRARIIGAIAVLAVLIGSLPFLIDVSSADTSYETRSIELMTVSGEPETLEVRFYSDAPHVPYYTLTGVYFIHSQQEMSVSADGTSYTYTNPISGVNAVFNTETGIIHVDDWEPFVQPYDDQDDSLPFVKLVSSEKIRQGGPAELSLKDYGITYYPEADEVWMPLSTAQDLLTSTYMYYMLFIDSSEPKIYEWDSRYYDAHLVDLRRYYTDDQARYGDVAAYEYKRLCFVMDYLYGCPDLSALGKELQSAKFDDVLNTHSDATRTVREWLQSTDKVLYVAGVRVLEKYLYDGGHTSFALSQSFAAFSPFEREVAEKVNSVEAPEIIDKVKLEEQLANARSQAWEDMDHGYFEKGDTAVFSFSSFTSDSEAWEAFYKDGGDLPDDTYGKLIKALERAKANPNIRNFVLDITTNGGGSSLQTMAVISMLIQDYSPFNTTNKMTGETTVQRYLADTNLDGVIDEKDLEKQYDFRFAILTTRCSFSCGNILPVYAQEKGIMIIGEKSGGGTCQVEETGLGYGISHMSSYVWLYNSKWQPMDIGAAPDLVLVDTSDPNADLSKLYDIDVISAQMNEYYAEKHSDPPYLLIAVGVIAAVLVIIAAVYLMKRNPVYA